MTVVAGSVAPASPSAPRRTMTTRTFVVALLGIIAIGGAVRALPGNAAMPYIRYVDEGHVLDHSAHMITHKTWDPDWYRYPPLMAEATAAAAVAAAPFTGLQKLSAGARTTDRSGYYEMIEPASLVLSGRIVVLIFSLITIAAIALLGARLAGRRVGLASAAIAAVLPAFVSRAFITTPDTAAACMFALSAWCASMVRGSPHRTRWVVLAGAASGLAFSAKYLPGIVVMAPLIVISAQEGISVARRLGLAAATLAAAVGTVIVTFPAALLKPQTVIDELRQQTAIYAGKATSHNYAHQLVSNAEVGWLLVGVSAVGLVLLLVQRPTRVTTVAILAPMVALAAEYLRYDDQPFRNLLPLMPLLCVAAGVAIIWVAERATNLAAMPRTLHTVAPIVVTALVVAVPTITGVDPFLRTATGTVDSRVEVRSWLQRNVGPTCTVAVPADAVFLPSELSEIDAHVLVESNTRQFPTTVRNNVDFVVAGAVKGRFPDWVFTTREHKAVATFGDRKRPAVPNEWRQNDQKLTIYRLRSCPK